ncbi:hypothetical protein AX17_007314 [Amanita inopinata Kibby_2008]|nr:hypothetical protein AX17_007314 [Amanita inopinata Kibby_2008]
MIAQSKSSDLLASIDESTALCLACSSSIPPAIIRRQKQRLQGGCDAKADSEEVLFTNCCERPICPSCVTTNPRLGQYDPCLHCLGGVDVIGLSQQKVALTQSVSHVVTQDQDVFILGEDEDDQNEDGEEKSLPETAPPPYEEPVQDTSPTVAVGDFHELREPAPVKYYLSRGDRLQGIALRFGVNGHELCRMNKLPPSTLNTTPHLLHTRTFILLPPSNTKAREAVDRMSGEDAERKVIIERERAVKKLQMVTKEVDWRIAKAYVALAEEEGEAEELQRKTKENGESSSSTTTTLSRAAIELYVEDSEWEETHAGRRLIR